MTRLLFKKLTDPNEALSILLSRCVINLKIEEMPLLDSFNLYLAEDIYAPINLPPYPRSTVDGYAVKSKNTWNASFDNPIKLRIVGEVGIGEYPENLVVNDYEAVKVATGSVIPVGADAVIPIEYTEEIGDIVEVYKTVTPGSNIAWPGSDVYREMLVARKGDRLLPNLIAVLAGLGIDKVKVYRRLSIGIISTGVELEKPGNKLKKGKIYDINTYLLASLVLRDGFKPKTYDIIPDDEEKLRETILKAVEENDVVLISGGTSVGPEDIVCRVLRSIGEVLVHGLKLKPGKPTIIAIVNGKPIFGLPGNPGSALNVYEVLVKEYLHRVHGHKGSKYRIRGILVRPAIGTRGRRTYKPVHVFKRNGKYLVLPLEFESYMIYKQLTADGVIVLEPGVHIGYGEGDEIDVELYKPLRDYDYIIMGELPSKLYRNLIELENAKTILMPSSTSFEMLSKDVCDIAIILTDAINLKEPYIDIYSRKINIFVARKFKKHLRRIAGYVHGSGLQRFNKVLSYLLGLSKNPDVVWIPVSTPIEAKVLLEDDIIDATIITEQELMDIKRRGYELVHIGTLDLIVIGKINRLDKVKPLVDKLKNSIKFT